jgi:hypothetical protein
MISFAVIGSSYSISNYKLFGYIATFLLHFICALEIIIMIIQLRIEYKEKKLRD